MKLITKLCLLGFLVANFTGCSAEVWKRTGYETLQNVKDQQCQKELIPDCKKRETYDAYQDKIKESEKAYPNP